MFSNNVQERCSEYTRCPLKNWFSTLDAGFGAVLVFLIAGPAKTAHSIDLVVAVATKTKWMDQFDVPNTPPLVSGLPPLWPVVEIATNFT